MKNHWKFTHQDFETDTAKWRLDTEAFVQEAALEMRGKEDQLLIDVVIAELRSRGYTVTISKD